MKEETGNGIIYYVRNYILNSIIPSIKLNYV